MKRILVTGGNGFIAQNIYALLKDRYDIIMCSRGELDLLDSTFVYNFISSTYYDVIIHTATYDAAPKTSTKNPTKVMENNLRMFFNLSRCSNLFGKLIFFGSGAEFNRDMWKPKMSESFFDQYVPNDQYGFSKYLMTTQAITSKQIFNLRIFGLFGIYDDWRYRLIPNLCCRALFDMPLMLNKNFSYDFMYIDDLIKILEWVINNNPRHQVYNVCSGQINSFKDIAEKINHLSGKKLDITIEDSLTQLEYSGDNSLLLQELPKFHFMKIEDGITKLYKWYEDNQDQISKDEIL